MTLGTASAQTTSTPIFVQPPQMQTPASAAGSGVSFRSAPTLQITRTVTVTRPERPMIWAGLASEYILPGASFGVSMPVRATPNLNMVLRGSAEAIVIPFADYNSPVPVILNADLLFSSPTDGIRVYGGPNVGTVMGYAWAFGGVLGVRNEFGKSNLGWYAESKGQMVFGSDTRLIILGLRFGLTYRF